MLQDMLYRHRRSDLLETVIGPAAAEAASTGLSDFRESLERVQKYLTRYKHVREQRAALEVCFCQLLCSFGLIEICKVSF